MFKNMSSGKTQLSKWPLFLRVFLFTLNSVTQGEIRVPAELEMDAIMPLHGQTHPGRGRQRSSKITYKYLNWLSNSLWFLFTPPFFALNSDLGRGAPQRAATPRRHLRVQQPTEESSQGEGARHQSWGHCGTWWIPFRVTISLEAPLTKSKAHQSAAWKQTQRAPAQGVSCSVRGWVWLSSLHQDTCISIRLCQGQLRRAGAEASTAPHTFLVYMNPTFIFHKKRSYFLLPRSD